MWAMIPMLRTRSSGYSCVPTGVFPGLTSRAITTCTHSPGADRSVVPYVGSLRSPLVMTKGLVGLCHLVRLFLAAYGGARVVEGVEQLAGELLRHRAARALARGLDEPAPRERGAAGGTDLDRHLVGRATDAPRLDLDERRRVADAGVEDLDGRTADGRLGLVEGAVDDRLRGLALPVLHHLADELLDGDAAVLAVRGDDAVAGTSTAWHLGARLLLLVGLGPVEAAALLAVLHSCGVEGAADDVVLDRRKVTHRAAADEHDGVLLEVVTDPG